MIVILKSSGWLFNIQFFLFSFFDIKLHVCHFMYIIYVYIVFFYFFSSTKYFCLKTSIVQYFFIFFIILLTSCLLFFTIEDLNRLQHASYQWLCYCLCLVMQLLILFYFLYKVCYIVLIIFQAINISILINRLFCQQSFCLFVVLYSQHQQVL